MEGELEKLQRESGTFKNNDTANISNDTIASHEKRLVRLRRRVKVLKWKNR